MPSAKFAFAFSILLLLAGCGGQEEATTENEAAPSETNAVDNETLSDPRDVNRSQAPGDEPVPPPDAVSHPDGYLPNAADGPPSSGAEPPDPPGAKAPPPATEDEYIRNRQAGS